MRLLALPRHFHGLVTVFLFAVMLAFPASAQAGFDPETLSTGTAGAQAQSESTGGPTSSNPALPKTVSDTATPTTESNSTARKNTQVVLTGGYSGRRVSGGEPGGPWPHSRRQV